jgi:hypothetical protein
MSRRQALLASVFLVGGATSFLVDPSPALAVENGDMQNGAKTTTSTTSPVCETQCVDKCRQNYGQTKSKGYQDCIDECKPNNVECQKDPPPKYAREPKLIPSQSIPNLYDRWQDELLNLN